MKAWARGLLALGIATGGLLAFFWPSKLLYDPPIYDRSDLSTLVQESTAGLISGTEKRLSWHQDQSQSEWSVIALHGFSASRQETAPLAEIVATGLAANLFEARFSGHGRQTAGLVGVTAESWLDDTVEALDVGRAIGKKTVVIAVSTGATLAMALLDHAAMRSVDALILISPNFAPADPKGMWITWPGGPLLLRLITGDTRSWQGHNDLQALYWTTTYPSDALIQVIRTVDRANEKIATTAAPRTQIFFSTEDKVVSIEALQAAYATLDSPHKELHETSAPDAPSGHMIAGDIISPGNTRPMAEKIVAFVLRQGQTTNESSTR